MVNVIKYSTEQVEALPRNLAPTPTAWPSRLPPRSPKRLAPLAFSFSQIRIDVAAHVHHGWPKRRAAYVEAWPGAERSRASGKPASRRLPPCFRNRLAELVAARRQKGICAEVREVRWQVSEHVGHLRKHPEEYTAALLGFLKSCTTA